MGAFGRGALCFRNWAVAVLAACVAVPAVLGACPPRNETPAAPVHATALNGVAWPDYCFEAREQEEHFFIIGDWGGIFRGPGVEPLTAPISRRAFVQGVDDRAQLLVAEQMKKRANISKPRYLINIGDNFYWGGVNAQCGESSDSVDPATFAQWQTVFEEIYDGPDLAGKPWLGVLGNHDYGGYMFTKGWDQAIAYTWGESDRWVTPAQYWSTQVQYSDFTVDYIFVDSNINDAFPPMDDQGHNICSQDNNPENATCGVTGPNSPADCTNWFARLWEEQVVWMENLLKVSQADWRVIVTHFPPSFRSEAWAELSEKYAVDLIITGHKHQQEVSDRDPEIGNAAWVISGGGGGIMSEGLPTADGNDDMYGFMDVAISKSQMKIESLSHSGIVRATLVIEPRRPVTTTSSTSTGTTTTLTSTTRSFRHHDSQQQGDITSGSPGGQPMASGLVTMVLALAACAAHLH
mmetsp:Transcript_118108/g.294479  ORF Transcript_118108/g.294479 Transcript_118108/m.294479 type:complete len:464 (-) Transcript_118108:418-1809(-)|eukprot:CAMPEP_0115210194 /NCGR_PEP_ID=MMETSP0270-20121206/22120_1 /TAXON_ID=71861 /ORGANISM="Scrippsiella trochoidea, Strain CCMP3099" /LENGTH=463 /DNA_ID=CAMNT_0002623839 /DNA_START=75 /DNA_END=1466 /DNA_ORIENTATION=-